jgi:hypothetical protein
MKIKNKVNERLADLTLVDTFHKVNDNIEQPLQLSTSYLQRKYKLTYQVASAVADVLKDISAETEIWHKTQTSLPPVMTPVLVEARKLNICEENGFDIFVAILDGHSGWMDKETRQPLYVRKWMEPPKDKIYE